MNRTADTPLHVQVAQALGSSCRYKDGWWEILRYDSDWAATGPLIQKYGIGLMAVAKHWTAWWTEPKKACPTCQHVSTEELSSSNHPHPLLAVCHLILALHKAGKLPPNV